MKYNAAAQKAHLQIAAFGGIGGGGQVDPKTSNDGSVALYSTFAATSFFSGTICNRIGARLTLALGAAGYALVSIAMKFSLHLFILRTRPVHRRFPLVQHQRQQWLRHCSWSDS